MTEKKLGASSCYTLSLSSISVKLSVEHVLINFTSNTLRSQTHNIVEFITDQNCNDLSIRVHAIYYYRR